MMYRVSAFTAYCFLFSVFISVCQSCPSGYDGSPCRDIQPPVLKCPGNVVTNTSKGKPTSSIAWRVHVTDNSVEVDPNAKIEVRSSHESGQELPIGQTVIRVTATDQAGNVATCDFQIDVKDNEPPSCSFCPSDIVREEIREEVRVGWERPRCSDNSGMIPYTRPNRLRFDRFKVPSSFLVEYEVGDDNGNSRIGCSFNVILKVKTCPSLPPPRNGALVCFQHERYPTCVVMCRTGTDFEFNPPFLYYCPDVKWNFFAPYNYPYERRTPWPDCSDKARPSLIMRRFPQYFYDGDARDPSVQEVIKSQFLSLMSTPFVPPWFCTLKPECTKDNILVSPGVLG